MRTTPAFPLVVLRVLLGGAIPDLGLVSAAPLVLSHSPGSSSLPKPSPMRSRDWHTFEVKRLDDGLLQQPTTATTTTNSVLAQRPRALSSPNVPAALGLGGGRSEPPMSVLHARANDAQTAGGNAYSGVTGDASGGSIVDYAAAGNEAQNAQRECLFLRLSVAECAWMRH